MPVVHWSARVFSTEGVLTSQGPSSKVSTTSLSFRKSSCLKCSNPKPGPPVVSICTTRETPRTSAPPLHTTFGPGGGGAAALGGRAGRRRRSGLRSRGRRGGDRTLRGGGRSGRHRALCSGGRGGGRGSLGGRG